jgi:hypothetical protein
MKPGDFPIGSLESRAAARKVLVRRNDNCKRMRIIWSIPSSGEDNSRVHFGEWQEWEDNTLGQIVYVPHVWVKPGGAVPACPDCGTPFKKTHEYPNLVGFEANWMDKHDRDLQP